MENLDIDTIKKRSVHGVFALTSRAFLLNVLSYIASLVIFTYLTPKEVGIFIAVTAIQRIISFVTDFGLGAALVQKKEDLTKNDLTTIFSVQSLVTLGIFIIVFVTAPFLSRFLNLDIAAQNLLLVLVFTIFLSSFKVIPSILLERSIQFHKLIIPQIVESLAYNSILIVLVINSQGLNSYSWAFLVSALISIPFYYAVAPWSVGFGINRNALSHLKYGVQFQAKNILATLKDDFLTIFLSKTLDFTQLGYIGFGQRNAFFIYRYIVDSVTKVTFSTFSRLQDNSSVLQKTIEKSLFYVTAITFPILTGIIIIAPYVVGYFPKWHNKWEPALLSLTFFCLNAIVSSMSGILVNVLDSTGRVKTTLRLMVLWTTLTWVLTPFLIYEYGYNGVAIASFLVTLTIGYTIFLVKKVVRFHFIKSVYKPFLSSIGMAIGTYAGGLYFVHNFIQLGFVIIGSGVIYGCLLYVLAKDELHADIKMLR